MKIINLNQKQLDDFVANQEHSQFLQSWDWSEFNDKLGAKVWRLGVEENGKLVATTTLIKKSLPLGRTYFYSPRGPVVKSQGSSLKFQVEEFLFSEIKKLAEQEKIVFFRFEPTSDLKLKTLNLKLFQTLSIQPRQTIILDLTKSEEELLGAMHPKTRYNIKLAGKKNLTLKHGQPNTEEFSKFWQLMETTKKRDNFSLHSQNYYRAMLASNLMELWQVYFKDQLLAVAIIAKFGDTATYVHGASSNDLRPLMAPYWLHWHLIKEAKKEGFKYYDLFGVDKVKWPGVTRFKEGWGGANIAYLGTFDLVFNTGYYRLYQLLRRLRRVF
jgi:lipid II:glycine glycyltransferase (peptidoglycan interpeptide bridge formation enzyme)